MVCLVLLCASCNKEEINVQEDTLLNQDPTSQLKEPIPQVMPQIGHDFRQVGFNYEVSDDGFQVVNNVPGVKSIHLDNNGITGEHWVYQSPSLQNTEIGFSVLYSDACLGAPCEVVVFMHGTSGTENSGATLFFNQYLNNNTDKPRAFIFANGIFAPTVPGKTPVWRTREQNGKNYNHPKQLWELFGGIMSDQNLFPFMKKDKNSWSVIGFSAGASGALGVFMDPIFVNYRQFQPKHIFPFGGFMTETLYKFMDFDQGMALWETCSDNSDVDLIIAMHMEDDVDCAGYTVYERSPWLRNRLKASNVPYYFLGLVNDIGDPCLPGHQGHNKLHSVKKHLNSLTAPAFKEGGCGVPGGLGAVTRLDDLLYREY